jgi:AICAR transformylase/IMP cyclohydrolase PurH
MPIKAFMTDPESAFGGIIAFNRQMQQQRYREPILSK